MMMKCKKHRLICKNNTKLPNNICVDLYDDEKSKRCVHNLYTNIDYVFYKLLSLKFPVCTSIDTQCDDNDNNDNIFATNWYEYINYIVKMITTNNKIVCVLHPDIEVSKFIFEYENNRGENVDVHDLVKNRILLNLIDNDSLETMQYFENAIEKIDITLHVDHYEFLKLAISLVNQKQCEDDVYIDYSKSDEYVNKYKQIYNSLDKISKAHFSRHIFTIKSDAKKASVVKNDNKKSETYFKNVEKNVVMHILVPIAEKHDDILNDVVKQVLSYSALSSILDESKKYNMRNKKNNIKLFEFALDIYKNKYTKNSIKQKIYQLIGIDYENKYDEFHDEMENKSFKGNHALPTMMLDMYNSWITDNNYVKIDNMSLEHIIPQSRGVDYVHRIGNLTLIRLDNNSITNTKGNSSLKNKTYQNKKESYVSSSIAINVEIVKMYKKFSQTEQYNRTQYLIKQLYIMFMSLLMNKKYVLCDDDYVDNDVDDNDDDDNDNDVDDDNDDDDDDNDDDNIKIKQVKKVIKKRK
jgi:hypothetical protein